MNTLVFDIETVPDTDLGRRLYGLHDLSDEQVAQIMFTKRRQETGSEFLSHEQHRVVAISVVMRSRDSLKLWSLGDEGSTAILGNKRKHRILLVGAIVSKINARVELLQQPPGKDRDRDMRRLQ